MTGFHLEAQIVDGELVAVAFRKAPSLDCAWRFSGTAPSDRHRDGADSLSLRIVAGRHLDVGHYSIWSIANWLLMTSRQRSQAVPSRSRCRAGLSTLPHKDEGDHDRGDDENEDDDPLSVVALDTEPQDRAQQDLM
jgi:hypothetical protein